MAAFMGHCRRLQIPLGSGEDRNSLCQGEACSLAHEVALRWGDMAVNGTGYRHVFPVPPLLSWLLVPS